MEMNGHECVAFCEIDKYARQSYKAIYETEGEEEWHDITQVSNDDFRAYRGRADVITGGFPCQAFSLAGKRRGFEDTRGTLFFHIARAIKEIQPSYALLENVKGLFSHDKGRTFGTIIQALDELGYVTEWGLFNSKFWGVPQNRERVYILVTRKDVYDQPKLFDLLKQQTEVTTRLVDVLEDEVDEKYYLSDEKTKKLTTELKNDDIKTFTYNRIQGLKTEINVAHTINQSDYRGLNRNQNQNCVVVPVLTPDRENKRQNGRRFKEDGEPMFTLTAQDRHGIAIREATKKGYTVAEHGDSVNISFPDSETRRGRVGKQTANTLLTGEEQGVVLGVVVRKVHSLEDLEERFMNESDFLKQGEIKQIIFDEFGVDRKCNRCTNQVLISDMKGYPYLCFECDENLFEVETYKDIEMVIGSTQKNAATTDGTLSSTLTSAMGQGGGHVPMAVYNELKIRKLTPLECWRLQGFTDEQHNAVESAGISNSQRYKQAGNAVTVNVIEAIGERLITYL